MGNLKLKQRRNESSSKIFFVVLPLAIVGFSIVEQTETLPASKQYEL